METLMWSLEHIQKWVHEHKPHGWSVISVYDADHTAGDSEYLSIEGPESVVIQVRPDAIKLGFRWSAPKNRKTPEFHEAEAFLAQLKAAAPTLK
jgi:hypothetical protein